jgi:hypothetical protein
MMACFSFASKSVINVVTVSSTPTSLVTEYEGVVKFEQMGETLDEKSGKMSYMEIEAPRGLTLAP